MPKGKTPSKNSTGVKIVVKAVGKVSATNALGKRLDRVKSSASPNQRNADIINSVII